jgi:hypothetical protein
MKSATDRISNQCFGGVFSVIADSLGKTHRFLPSSPGSCAERPAAASTAGGVTSRLGGWLLRRQMDGMAPALARSQDVFDRLDQWMWRQHTREVESYLAKSDDIFDLERRMKALERGPAAGIL